MKFFNYLRKYKFIVIIFIILVAIYFYLFNDDEEVYEVEINNVEQTEVNVDKIKVDIKGAVNNPGVYELESNSRVSDAINVSGGLTDNADTSTINLSKNIFDEMVIIVYTKEEIEEIRKGSVTVKYIEKECVCPKIENDACIDNLENDTIESSNKISLNNATLDELMTLSGIGEAKAKAIIEYREKNPFKSIDEITNIKGIGTSIYEKIKDNITI